MQHTGQAAAAKPRHEPRRTRHPAHTALGAARLAVAALTATALGVTADHAAETPGGLVNFFSYFTIESNILGVLVFAAGGAALLAGRRDLPGLPRGAAALYLVITGLVYALLLASNDTGSLMPWVNDVLHRATPLLFAADWLLAPPDPPVRPRRATLWLILPLAYLPYTLIRGHAVDWYPYPFTDPRPHGYLHVTLACVAVTAAFLAAGAALCWSGARLRERRDQRTGRERGARGSASISR